MKSTNPYKLLAQYKHQASQDYFKYKYIFEAGFKDLKDAIDFYLECNFKKFQGVDIEPESQTMSDNEFVPCQNHFDTYIEQCKIKVINTPMSQDEFNVVFNRNNKTKIEDFIEVNPKVKEKFDVGVFTKLFHLLDDKEIPMQIVKWFNKNSNENALMLFSVRTSNIDPIVEV